MNKVKAATKTGTFPFFRGRGQVRLAWLLLTFAALPAGEVAGVAVAAQQMGLVALDDGHDLAASLDRIFEETRAFLRPLTGA